MSGDVVLALTHPEYAMRSIVAASLVLAACSRLTSPTGRFEVTTEVAPASFRVGEVVAVTVTVTNRTDRAQAIETNGCLPSFEVTTANGTVVGPSQRTCSLLSLPRILESGEEFVFTQTWSGDAIRAGADAPPVMLTPGAYLVRGRPFGARAINPAVAVQINP